MADVMADAKFNAVVEAKEGLTVSCKSRDFEITLDEPKDLGGNDLGMNPVECLLNAIGACKTIVARSFAEAHNLDIKNIRIEVEGTLNPNGFLGLDKDAKIGFSSLETNYYFESDEDEEKLQEFIKFVDGNCPVMDTIVNTPSSIVSKLNRL
ncbi:MAG: OsmC family protein [Clostridiaceae bacterium]|nr:OsmC family protein [Clostridiaceae bacterium]MBW4860518.1 OsmC family protein [Clostridiaceae bacterium]MBW4868434.1 OsmC family protein [Clostridiaceae bacterium]